MIGSFAHIIFFTYICHGLVEESTNISIASYSGWWVCLPMSKTGKKIRKDMKMMMMKAMRPCQLTAGGFFLVNLETSTAVCNNFLTLISRLLLKYHFQRSVTISNIILFVSKQHLPQNMSYLRNNVT